MAVDYKTLKEAEEKFRWSERWDFFGQSFHHLNISQECLDRHMDNPEAATRLKNSDGRTEVYSFEQLSRFSSQFAHMLVNQGLEPGDRVAI
ncbi:MAG: acetate--CoA ligase, partial [Thermodesulfobacteriota bacterium]